MKHSKNSSNRHLLPRHGSSSACDDDGSSLACDQYRSSTALKEMAREQSLVTQLRAVVLPALQASDERAEVVAQMFEAILDCSAKVMAALKLLRLDHGRADGAQLPVVVDDKRRVRKIFSDNGDKDDVDNAKPHRQRKRRRLADDCVTLETPVPHYDGHEWRKYGQKLINNTKHPRSYYRCTYKQEQDCRATKTVQQQQQKEDGGGPSSADDPAMYAVVYYGQHTCRPGETASTGHSVCGGDELARSDSLSQCSNILVTCTSVIVDHHRQTTTTTTSLESNCKLLDMAEELTTAEMNKDELFDMAAYTPLDFDTTWEVMDAHGYGLVMFGDNC